MADKQSVRMTTGIPGIEIAIWYNDVNRRIGAVTWQIDPPGIAARLRVWDSNISTETPVIDRTEGQGSGAQNIPGNYQMIEVTEPEIGTYLTLPPNISYVFTVRTV